MRAPDSLHAGLAQTKETHLPGLYQPGHRADHLLDGHGRIDPVLVEDVDVVRTEAAERSFDGGDDVLRSAVRAANLVIRDVEAELGGEHHLLTPTCQGATHQALVDERAVDLGRVEVVDAEFQRTVDGGDRLRVIGRPVQV